MRTVRSTPKFEKAYRKFVRRHPWYQQKLDHALRQIPEDVYAPGLETHKLSGKLAGLWACTCGYDCRIVFALEKDRSTDVEVIVLIDIGTHEEVY